MTTSENPSPVVVPKPVVDSAREASRITVLTGAGMSAESGIATFRDAQSGLWKDFDPKDLASPEGWLADSDLVWGWYQWRAELVRRSEPNAGHVALARWQQQAHVDIATQNVDDLHERAGAEVLAHVHGSLFEPYCSDCGTRTHLDTSGCTETDSEQRIPPPECSLCGGLVRPGAVWFGESLPEDAWAAAEASVREADLVLVVGTSGVVYPFAGLPAIARSAGATVVEINPVETEISDMADHRWRTTAAVGLPALVAQL
ncbi:NAD-dependent deacylase [Rhodococcus sp. ARC_M5]|uniref:SIR2 family NAD-dependent protein deacylase n=1 Tax=Rhodococcus sp. ARC_M5 TaxID=2928851 RepID=UPI0027E0D772|nr:NAD-dependent deacylase [Rhodococcus sp. ARC_M5]